MDTIKAWLFVLLSACAAVPQGGDVLRVGLSQWPMSLDPRYATDAASQRVQAFIHRGLVKLDENFLPIPDAAERWSHPDPLTWRFTLQSGLFFHNGTPVRAADAAATLQSILDEKRASPLRAGFSAIESIEAESERVLVIHLKRVDASFLTRLTIGILPESVAKSEPHDRTTIGCGPYRLLKWDVNSIDIASVKSGASIQRIRFLRVKDPITRCLKLARGEIDFMQNDIPPHLIAYLKKIEGVEVHTRPSTTFSYIGFNLQDPILSDVRVRRALALATDRRRIKAALLGDLPTLAETVLPPDHWAAARLLPLPYNPDESERLLDAAGFKRGKGGVRFQLVYRTSTDPLRVQIATAIANQWRKIGVAVKIESMEWGGFYARIKSGDFQVYSLSWVAITDPDIYRWILHSKMWPPKGANRGRYADPEVDRWLEAASETEDVDERRRFYAMVEQKMHEDMVYLPLWYEPVVAVSGPRLRGFRPAADGSLLGLMNARLQPAGRAG